MSETSIKVEYAGSKGWLIFWAIVFFPVALILLATAAKFRLDEKTYYLRYDGSRRWLAFWTIFFYPAALILLVLNGVSLVTEQGALGAS